jgi:hypothetical protein
VSLRLLYLIFPRLLDLLLLLGRSSEWPLVWRCRMVTCRDDVVEAQRRVDT